MVVVTPCRGPWLAPGYWLMHVKQVGFNHNWLTNLAKSASMRASVRCAGAFSISISQCTCGFDTLIGSSVHFRICFFFLSPAAGWAIIMIMIIARPAAGERKEKQILKCRELPISASKPHAHWGMDGQCTYRGSHRSPFWQGVGKMIKPDLKKASTMANKNRSTQTLGVWRLSEWNRHRVTWRKKLNCKEEEIRHCRRDWREWWKWMKKQWKIFNLRQQDWRHGWGKQEASIGR